MKSFITALFLLLALATLALAAGEPKQMINVNQELAPWRAYYDQQSPWPGHHGWKPFKRYEWDAIQRGWPDGNIPVGGLWQGFLHREQMPRYALTDTWTNLGPYNHGGRARVIRFLPGNPTIMFAGAVGGGLFKSTNSGNSWFPITEQLPNVAIGSFEIDPSNPQIMYLGTGEGYYNGDAVLGIGLLKSTDGGATWNTTGLSYEYSQGKSILKINIDPRDGQIVLASTNDGLYRSTNGGATFTMVRTGDVKDLKRDPQTLDNMCCAVGNPWGSNANGIYRSTDNGQTWTRYNDGLPLISIMGRIVIDYYPANSQIIYAGVSGTFSHNGSQMIGIFRSVDNGLTWTQMSPDGINHYAGQAWYDMAIAVKPDNPNLVLSSGLDTWRSTNSGLAWQQKTWWYYPYGNPDFVHADHHEIVFNPTNYNEVWEVTDGGIFRSQDLGDNWTEMNTGFVSFQYYAMGNATLDTSLCYGGLQDNGTFRWDGSPNGTQVFGGDGGYCVVDYTDDNTVYAEWQGGHRNRSDDGGNNFVDINPGIDGDGAWVTPMVLDPLDHNTIYTTTANNTPRVWKSPTQGSGNWSVVGSPVGGNNQCLEVCPLVPGRLYLASDASVYRYEQGGDWVGINGNLANAYVTHIVPDRFNPQGVYVTLSGFGHPHVYKSMQAGTVWTDITGNLPDVPTNDIVQDLADASTLYVGTDIGVFFTEDGGSTWAIFGDGLPAVRVDDMDMQVATGKLRIVTHGRGLWEIPTGNTQTAIFYPNGGEILSPGEVIALRWGGTSYGGNVRLDVNRSYPSSTWQTLFASTPNDGQENWTVTGPESDHVRFRLQNLSQPQQADTSNEDSRIMAAGLQLLWPNGGETVLSGVRDTIRFDRILATDPVRIELNREYPNGTWEELATGIGMDTYLWPVQLPGGDHCRIRIASEIRPELADTSAADFILRAPVMTMTAPNGGEQLPIGAATQILWNAPEHQGNVRITLNRDYPGGAWEVISANTANDGVQPWTPSGATSDHCRVRVAATFDPNQTYVESAGDFALVPLSAGEPAPLPKEYTLGQPYPNPFNPSTEISLALPSRTHIRAAVFNRLGQQVAVLADEDREAGYVTLTFEGARLSSGIYFIRVSAYDQTQVLKAVLMK